MLHANAVGSSPPFWLSLDASLVNREYSQCTVLRGRGTAAAVRLCWEKLAVGKSFTVKGARGVDGGGRNL